MSATRSAMAAAFALAAAAPAAAQSPPTVTVNLASYAYSPNPIVLQGGRPVTLVFVNRSGSGHDFTARSFFARSRIVSGAVGKGEIDLRPGQSAQVTLIPVRGTYKVHCGHFFHKQLGMRGTIIVH